MSKVAMRIIRSGPFSTIQDMGRTGFMAWGVPVSGAADSISMRIANSLCGNGSEDAAIECTMGGFSAEFLEDTRFAIAGAQAQLTLDSVDVLPNCAQKAKKGSVLSIGSIKNGARIYIAVSGGVAVPDLMESKSTYTKGKLGGFDGRALSAEDILYAGDEANRQKPMAFPEGLLIPSLERETDGICILRVTQGSMPEKFADDAIESMLCSVYEVSPVCDRMGIRLLGPKVAHKLTADIISGGIEPGAVQVPGSGEPIILMADRQTTGGYTKAFSVITADRPKLGQLRPGDRVSFRMVTLDEAYHAFLLQEGFLRRLMGPKVTGKQRAFTISIDGMRHMVEVEEIL